MRAAPSPWQIVGRLGQGGLEFSGRAGAVGLQASNCRADFRCRQPLRSPRGRDDLRYWTITFKNLDLLAQLHTPQNFGGVTAEVTRGNTTHEDDSGIRATSVQAVPVGHERRPYSRPVGHANDVRS